MVEQDKVDFANAVKEVLKSYNQEAGRMTLRIWWAALVNHDLDVVLNAMAAYCADPDRCRFAPKAVDIVAIIEGSRADRKELAVMAFAKVLENANRYATVVFDDPAIHHAVIVAFGSWENVSDFNESDFESQQRKRDFITAYAAFKSTTPYQPKLIGLHERENAAGGHLSSVPSVTYIGDRKKAMAVESGGRTATSGNAGAIASDAVAEMKAIA